MNFKKSSRSPKYLGIQGNDLPVHRKFSTMIKLPQVENA